MMGEHTRCDTCLNRHMIISENGFRPICCLPQKHAVDCVTRQENYYLRDLNARPLRKRGD